MLAATSAAAMLNEIQSETASQLMNSVLYQTSPPGSTGLPSLDAHLLFSTPDHASPTSSLNRGDVLEIQGPAASGKTQLLYHLTMKCILPRDITVGFTDISLHPPQKMEVGGWCKAAVIIDTDGRWSVLRLKHLISRRLEQLLPSALGEFHPPIHELVTESMKRVHVFRPTSSASLAATLLRLSSYHAEHMPSLEISLLAIGSISAFYWVDRYALEQQRQASADKKEVLNPLSKILIALQEFRLSHGPVTVLTNWGLIPASKISPGATSQTSSTSPAPSPYYRQHLHPFPAPFEVPPHILPNAHFFPPITHHITLLLPTMQSIPLTTSSLKEARALERQRTAVAKGDTTGIIRTVEGGKITTFTLQIHRDEVSG